MVNIQDYEIDEQPENKIKDIFAKQRELMAKYHEIEAKNGFEVFDPPLNLHDAKHQARLKDFAWRITEELGEALEAHWLHPDLTDHYDEELADALHFLVELSILADFTPENGRAFDLEELFGEVPVDHCRSYIQLVFHTGLVIENLARTMNCLKNKPWKQSQMLTDVDYFYSRLEDTWMAMIRLFKIAGIDADRCYELYFRKHKVNKFRQRSDY